MPPDSPSQSVSSLHGEALRQHLRDTRTGLPSKTLAALVLGGLRVRILRSAVTMVSIVLAIAFLAYMGMNNNLTYSLAESVVALEQSTVDTAGSEQAEQVAAEITEMRQMLRSAGVNIEATLGGDPMDTWLVVMALLTCTVGIANAMLMSVTERFREIATMKCLGAQDGLVVKLFLFESSLLGVVGAVAGVILGIIVALLAGMAQFGGYATTYFPVGPNLMMVVWSLLAGVGLAVIGTVYPALIAARMRPVDALRVEE